MKRHRIPWIASPPLSSRLRIIFGGTVSNEPGDPIVAENVVGFTVVHCLTAINCETRTLCAVQQQLTGSSAILVHGQALDRNELGARDVTRASRIGAEQNRSCSIRHPVESTHLA